MSCRQDADNLCLVLAAGIADAAGTVAAPGAVLLRGHTVVAAGSPEQLGRPADAQIIDATGQVLLPGLVNAHAHLDLSGPGPGSPPTSFPAWVEDVRALRATLDAEAIAAAVETGVQLSLAGGTAFIGDIAGAGSPVPLDVLRDGPLGGVSYFEVFGLGDGASGAAQRLRDHVAATEALVEGVRAGVSPHAPYSCGPVVYATAASLGRPIATHIAETPEELQYALDGTGPIADMRAAFGLDDAGLAPLGAHPIDALGHELGAAPIALVHLNHIEPRHMQRIATWPATAVYCPRATAFFGHHEHTASQHPWRSLLAAGVPVALGTDSLLCLDTPDRIGVLDEMRLLARRDGADGATLLTMATTTGAALLGVDLGLVTFQPGPVGGVLAIDVEGGVAGDPVDAALASRSAPSWVVSPA